MSLVTPWGYSVENDEAVGKLISLNDFNELTAGKYNGDVRISETVKAASSAIRNYCGWHIFPRSACTFSERLYQGNGRIKRAGADILIQLPATYVTAVSAVKINGAEKAAEDYAFETNGLLRIFDVSCTDVNRKTEITVEYTSGLPEKLMDSIKELVAHRVTHALVSPAGIASESAGGVSVTYNANWINSARATALPSDNKEVLEPYRVKGVF